MSYGDITSKLWCLDARLRTVCEATAKEITPSPSVDVYTNLLHSIVSQQLSTKVADIIWQRFLDLFVEHDTNPRAVVEMEFASLRGVGLSGSKSQYIQNVAQFALKNDMSIEKLVLMSDEDIIDYLTTIKGVGKWTVQMILMFPMDRPNVFPIDDLGIQTKMKYWYGLTSEKKALKLDMLSIAEKWSPFKTVACKYLWASTIPKS